MTRLLDRRDGPRDLRGRSRPDRGMSVLKVLVDRYIGVVAPLGTGTDNVARPDPEIRLIVSHKEVVAADEDVVRLTLQRRTAPRYRRGTLVRTSTCTWSPDGAGSTRCAETPQTPAATSWRCAVCPTAVAAHSKCTRSNPVTQ